MGPALSPSDVFLAAKEGLSRAAPLSGFLARLLGEAGVDSGCGQESKTALAPRPRQRPHPAAMLESPWRSPAWTPSPREMASYLRSFWLRKPSFIFSTTLASIELASLAKSRSRISDTGTETMAKASLSSLVGHVPSWEATGKQRHPDRAMPGTSPPSATNPGEDNDPACPHWKDWAGL